MENNKNKDNVDNNLQETVKLFTENSINYWICHGTLLGIIRDKELIPWDHDVDLAVWDKDGLREKIKELMLKNSYCLKEKYLIKDDLLTFLKTGGREVDINFYKLKDNKEHKQMAYIEWFVPKNNFLKIIDAMAKASLYNGSFKFFINKIAFLEKVFLLLKKFLIKKNIFFKSIGYTQPYSLLDQFKKINFQGIEVVVPYRSEEYLAWVYGNDWKKPKESYNWIKDSPSTKEV